MQYKKKNLGQAGLDLAARHHYQAPPHPPGIISFVSRYCVSNDSMEGGDGTFFCNPLFRQWTGIMI